MKYTEESWKTAYKNAADKASKIGHGPSDGIVCIMATLAFIKNGLIADKLPADKVEASIKELFASLQSKEVSNGGFACNASAAMKFAGLKAQAADVTALEL